MQAALGISAAAVLAILYLIERQAPAVLFALFMVLGAARRFRRTGSAPAPAWWRLGELDDFGRRRAEQERRRALAGPDGMAPLSELVTADALSQPPPSVSAASLTDPLGALLSAQESYRRAMAEPLQPPTTFEEGELPASDTPRPGAPSKARPASRSEPLRDAHPRLIVERPRGWRPGRRRAPPGSIVQ